MRLLYFAVGLAVAASGFADTITLRNGRVIDGTYLGGSARQVRVEFGDRIQTIDVSDIARIEFSGSSQTQAYAPAPMPAPAPPPEDRPLTRRTAAVARPEPAPAPMGALALPAGTNLVVRLIDGVDSDVNRVGQTFAGSIDEPVVYNGMTVIPRGADVITKLVDSKEAGTFTGRSELALSLVSVKVNGRVVKVNTQTVTRESEARGNDTAKRAAGVGALGAVIGAIAGGGKGAALGATAGAAAGAGSQVVTKGPQVKIPSETRLTFVLDTPVTI